MVQYRWPRLFVLAVVGIFCIVVHSGCVPEKRDVAVLEEQKTRLLTQTDSLFCFRKEELVSSADLAVFGNPLEMINTTDDKVFQCFVRKKCSNYNAKLSSPGSPFFKVDLSMEERKKHM